MSLVGGMTAFALTRQMPTLVPEPLPLQIGLRITSFAISCLLVYRAAMFIHEIVHRRSGELPGFAIAWNLFSGIPFLTPSFLYYTHLDHHRSAHYGTDHDGEYLPLRHGTWRLLVFFLFESVVYPLLVMVRFAILTPLVWFVPPVRRWLYRHMSSLVIDPAYVRPLCRNSRRRGRFWFRKRFAFSGVWRSWWQRV